MQETPEGVTFKVLVQPRGAKNKIVGLHGDALKVKLTAPPVEGAANKMCVAFLAKCLQVKKSDVEIIRGHSSRSKTVMVRSASKARVQALIKSEG